MSAAAQLEISALIPQDTLNAFNAAMDRYRTELGNNQVNAIRRGTIMLIQSLRKLTPSASKRIPRKAVKKFDGINNNGQRIPKWHRVYGGAMRRYTVSYLKDNKIVRKIYLGDSASEVWRERGHVFRYSLAKASWGKFMTLLFNRAAPKGTNPRARVTNEMVHGYFKEYETGPKQGVDALLVNELNYISNALTPDDLASAMTAATKRINGVIDKGILKAGKEFSR